MPEEFDENWEYWMPSEEMQEFLDSLEESDGFSRLGIDGDRAERDGGNIGFRFGCGSSLDSSGVVRLGRLRSVLVREMQLIQRKCDYCGRHFEVPQSNRTRDKRWFFCSRECSDRRVRKVFCANRICLTCGREFIPCRGDERYCSRRCGASKPRIEVTRIEVDGCPICGKEVGRSCSKNGKPKMYCTRRCAQIAGKRRWNKKDCLMSLEDAQQAILKGVEFGTVFSSVSAEDGVKLKEWFVRMSGVPNLKARNKDRPSSEITGELCKQCGGLMVRTGTCLTCQYCGDSSGGCG